MAKPEMFHIIYCKQDDYKMTRMNIRLSLQILEITENIGQAFLKKILPEIQYSFLANILY